MQQILINKGELQVSKHPNLLVIETDKGVSLGLSNEAAKELFDQIETICRDERIFNAYPLADYPEAAADMQLINDFRKNKSSNREQ